MIQRVVMAAAVLVLVGCAYDTELGSTTEASTITEQCRVRGLGLLDNGDFFAGRILGSGPADVDGTWVHIIPAEECECGGRPGRGRGVGHERHRGRGHDIGRGRGHDHGDCEPHPEVILLEPERVLCRINGVDIVDFDGPATVNGVSGYTYAINILDQADPGDPIRDFYTLTVYDSSGAVAEFRDGEVVTGDVDVDIP